MSAAGCRQPTVKTLAALEMTFSSNRTLIIAIETCTRRLRERIGYSPSIASNRRIVLATFCRLVSGSAPEAMHSTKC